MKGWEEKTLDELGTVGRGKSRHRPRNAPHLYGGNYPFIQTGDIEAALFYVNSYSNTYSDAGLAQSKLWAKNTLCISIVGANTAATAILGFDACFPDSVIGFVPDESKSDVKFVKYSLEAIRYKLKNISEGAARENLSLEKLLSVKMPIPPIEYQKKIVSIVSPYDDLIENNLRRIKLLEELAQRTYEEWFVKFRVNGEQLVVNEETGLPVGWEKRKIGGYIKTASGGTPSRKKESIYFDNGTIPWIRTQELKNSIIIEADVKITQLALKESSARLFPAKTVLLAMYGNTIGQTAYLAIEASTNQACCAFLNEEKEYRSYYYHQFLLNNKELILSYRMGAAQENISQEIIKSIEIVAPNETVLMDFAISIEPCYKQIENLTIQNRHLKESRDLLLPRLMSGALAVKSEE